MWPWLNTAVSSRAPVQRRISSWSIGATTDEPGVDHDQAVVGRRRRSRSRSSGRTRSRRRPRRGRPRARRVQLGGRDLAAPEAVGGREDVVHDGRPGGVLSWRACRSCPLVLRRRGVAAFLHALLELRLRRAEAAGDLRELCAAEHDEADGDDDQDHVQACNFSYLHDPSNGLVRPLARLLGRVFGRGSAGEQHAQHDRHDGRGAGDRAPRSER